MVGLQVRQSHRAINIGARNLYGQVVTELILQSLRQALLCGNWNTAQFRLHTTNGVNTNLTITRVTSTASTFTPYLHTAGTICLVGSKVASSVKFNERNDIRDMCRCQLIQRHNVNAVYAALLYCETAWNKPHNIWFCVDSLFMDVEW